ncbi:hypothetical protein D9Q98_008436 [Chlorella vulgaris]|uniref:Plant synaptotagmin n=1 Tax=Chlorella vulgaris TaxID=3077 RepID=A0A9D4TGS3_CHLVU|nr:hypothetical protein D9Q98_008436 [Chlorella vulgaris]
MPRRKVEVERLDSDWAAATVAAACEAAAAATTAAAAAASPPAAPLVAAPAAPASPSPPDHLSAVGKVRSTEELDSMPGAAAGGGTEQLPTVPVVGKVESAEELDRLPGAPAGDGAQLLHTVPVAGKIESAEDLDSVAGLAAGGTTEQLPAAPVTGEVASAEELDSVAGLAAGNVDGLTSPPGLPVGGAEQLDSVAGLAAGADDLKGEPGSAAGNSKEVYSTTAAAVGGSDDVRSTPGSAAAGSNEVNSTIAGIATGAGEERLHPTQGAAAAGAAPEERQDSVTGVEKGGGEERQDWVVQLLTELWPYARDAAEAMAWELIPAQLEASRPPFVYALEMERFHLGKAEPTIRDIRLHRGDGSGIEELFLEFEAEWHSQQDIVIRITVPKLPVAVAQLTPDPLEEAMRLLMTLRVSLKDAWLRAGVRVALRPLLRRMPVIGALQVGLTRVPEFGYDLNLSLASAALVPLLKTWIDQAIRDLVMQPLVLPEHIFFPIDPSVEDVERPAGVLAVHLIGADHVPKPSLFANARPFVELYVRDSQRRQSHVAAPGRVVVWDSRFELPLNVPEHQELTVILYDYNDWSPNDELGRARLVVRDLVPGQQQEVCLRVKAPAAEEEKHEEEKSNLSRGERIAMALGRPFTKKDPTVCELHLVVTYLPLDEAGAEQVMRLRQRAGQAPAALPDRAASAGRIEVAPDGQTPQQAPAELPQQLLHPLVQRMLQSGLLQVGVPRAQGMLAGRPAGVSGYIKPYYKVSVKVGGREAQTDAAQSNRQGVVEFSRPAALHLEPEAVGEEGAQVEIELLENGILGAPRSCGRLVLPLRQLVAGGKVSGERRLEGEGTSAKVQLDASFKYYF